jgi:ABC-type transport system substrate-binding protein
VLRPLRRTPFRCSAGDRGRRPAEAMSGNTTMLRRSLLTGTAAALATPAFAQPAAARVLRYVPQTDLTVLDPVFTTAYITRHHALMIYDQLYGLDAQLRP